MEENKPPKEYKYKLNADDFVKLFLASDEEFEDILSSIFNKSDNSFIDNVGKTIRLKNIEIEGKIEIKNPTLNCCNRL